MDENYFFSPLPFTVSIFQLTMDQMITFHKKLSIFGFMVHSLYGSDSQSHHFFFSSCRQLVSVNKLW